MSYRELLRDVRWQKLRLEALSAAEWKCQSCGGNDFLNVHHRKYVDGRKPWEYSLTELKVLCEKCHQKIHGLVFIPDREDEGQHLCGDWMCENWKRIGTNFFVNGIPLKLAKWDFGEDGAYGAISFEVSDLIFNPGSNNGASYFPFKTKPKYPGCDAHGVQIGGLVRCATPCMQNGENFMPFPMEWFILQAAQFAIDNLDRK
jgi:hypothetical protein